MTANSKPLFLSPGESMTCCMCGKTEVYDPERASNWRGIEFGKTLWHVCPAELPPDGSSVGQFELAYKRILNVIMEKVAPQKPTPFPEASPAPAAAPGGLSPADIQKLQAFKFQVKFDGLNALVLLALLTDVIPDPDLPEFHRRSLRRLALSLDEVLQPFFADRPYYETKPRS